jgi:hypothetical protein
MTISIQRSGKSGIASTYRQEIETARINVVCELVVSSEIILDSFQLSYVVNESRRTSMSSLRS